MATSPISLECWQQGGVSSHALLKEGDLAPHPVEHHRLWLGSSKAKNEASQGSSLCSQDRVGHWLMEGTRRGCPAQAPEPPAILGPLTECLRASPALGFPSCGLLGKPLNQLYYRDEGHILKRLSKF